MCKDKKCILIVNVASKCAKTKQNYTELVELYSRYASKGLQILAFPSNVNGQEPGTNDKIKEFALKRNVTFPLFAKIDVNGPAADPVYKFLRTNIEMEGTKDETVEGIKAGKISTNFAKFVVDFDGKVKYYFKPSLSPLSFENQIKSML